MSFNLKPANFFFWVLSIGLGIAGLSFASHEPDLKSSNPRPDSYRDKSSNISDEDTVKYRGYRLELINFEILRQTDDWVKIRFDVVNSGRMDVDFSKKGTEHWVQFRFDHTLFSHKLGGLRENIRHTLYQENFKLATGQRLERKELKVPVVMEIKTTPPAPVADGFETKIGIQPTPEPEPDAVFFTGKGGEEEPANSPTVRPGIADDCPDIYFQQLRIIQQDDKWATIEYTIANKGFGVFKLFEKGAKNEEKLVVKAFISGVPTLSRGALPSGGQIVKPSSGQSGDLLPGDTYTGTMKVDVRKKTRYMKSLILSLDSDQFRFECDKTNNTDAVILE